jgi:MFS family permease
LPQDFGNHQEIVWGICSGLVLGFFQSFFWHWSLLRFCQGLALGCFRVGLKSI